MWGRFAKARMRQNFYSDVFGRMRYAPTLTDKT